LGERMQRVDLTKRPWRLPFALRTVLVVVVPGEEVTMVLVKRVGPLFDGVTHGVWDYRVSEGDLRTRELGAAEQPSCAPMVLARLRVANEEFTPPGARLEQIRVASRLGASP